MVEDQTHSEHSATTLRHPSRRSDAKGAPVLPPCDVCRTQKTKCYVDTEEGEERRCRTCIRRKLKCEWCYVYKRPGRPSRSRVDSKSVTPGPPPQFATCSPTVPDPTGSTSQSTIPSQPSSTENNQPTSSVACTAQVELQPPPVSQELDSLNGGPDVSSIFGSAHYAMSHAEPSFAIPSSFDFVVSPSNSAPSPWFPILDSGPAAPSLPSISGASATPESNPNLQGQSSSSSTIPFQPNSESLHSLLPQLENVTTWADVNVFLSLYLRHLHFLVPVVHKPSFLADIVHRRDKSDESFRALLFSIVTFTICQCPVQLMTPHCSLETLDTLLRTCMQASRALQKALSRRPSLNLLISTSFDWISVQATGRYGKSVADVLAGETRRLIYSLKLHQEESSKREDVLHREMRRRVFWSVYSTDKTFSLNGYPMIIHDIEGLPELPVQVDDECIFKDGIRSGPAGGNPSTPSFLVGFVSNCRLFEIISQSIVHRRSLQTQSGSRVGRVDPATIEKWVEAAFVWISEIMEELPVELKNGSGEHLDVWGGLSGGKSGATPLSPYGTQQANILVTALSAEFSLLDLKALLSADNSEVEKERHRLAKRAYETLASIPLENIAANGESMRGKVFRTILSLLNTKDDAEKLAENVWDWWNIYSRVQFLQIAPDIPASGTNTGPASPGLDSQMLDDT
ncbi:hypothetical protein T439DRAFT_327121 [Meredithblackwellia eburnea MCA 4105]